MTPQLPTNILWGCLSFLPTMDEKEMMIADVFKEGFSTVGKLKKQLWSNRVPIYGAPENRRVKRL